MICDHFDIIILSCLLFSIHSRLIMDEAHAQIVVFFLSDGIFLYLQSSSWKVLSPINDNNSIVAKVPQEEEENSHGFPCFGC